MITSYNRAYITQAIRSVLAQDPGPDRMQIEVVDDHSTQLDIESLVKEAGQGRVSFHRNPQNVGLIPNWNVCLQRARGQWVHILHDDDLVYDGFYNAMEAAITAAPSIGAAFCAARLIDAQGRQVAAHRFERPNPGIFPDLFRRFLIGNAIQFAAVVVRRDAYAQVGPFDNALDYVADWDMWMRIAARFPVWYEPQTLAAYRQHAGSETAAIVRSGRERRGYTAAADRWLQYAGQTPENIGLHQYQKAIFAIEGLHLAAASFARGDSYAGIHQFRAALDCSMTPAVLKRARDFLPYLLAYAPLDLARNQSLLASLQSPANRQFAQSGDPEAWRQLLDFMAQNSPA